MLPQAQYSGREPCPCYPDHPNVPHFSAARSVGELRYRCHCIVASLKGHVIEKCTSTILRTCPQWSDHCPGILLEYWTIRNLASNALLWHFVLLCSLGPPIYTYYLRFVGTFTCSGCGCFFTACPRESRRNASLCYFVERTTLIIALSHLRLPRIPGFADSRPLMFYFQFLVLRENHPCKTLFVV